MSWGLVHAQMIRLKFTRIQGHFAFLDSFANFARLQLILLVFGHRALIGNLVQKILCTIQGKVFGV